MKRAGFWLHLRAIAIDFVALVILLSMVRLAVAMTRPVLFATAVARTVRKQRADVQIANSMKRKLFIFLSAASLAVCGIVVVIWIMSHIASEILPLKTGDPGGRLALHEVRSVDGQIGWTYQSHEFVGSTLPEESILRYHEDWSQRAAAWNPGNPAFAPRPSGFKWGHFYCFWQRQKSPRNFGIVSITSRLSVSVPYWFLCLLTALLPISRFVIPRIGQTRRERKRLGLCLNCGYDLRASTDRCPECGTEIVT
jgi:hypothetical protein